MKKLMLILVVGFITLQSCQQPFYDQGEFPQDGSEHEGHYHGDEGSLTLYAVNDESISKIKDFDVPNKYLDFQANIQLHEDVWNFVTSLIPGGYRDKISQFMVFHGEEELLGYVVPIDHNDLSRWVFGLALDAAEGIETIDLNNDFTYTVIHEFGHILSLNDEQVIVGDEGECPQYFTGEGCSTTNSYINRIVELGWSDILDETVNSDPYEVYQKYQSRFVSEYAATNPGEDIAEVFTIFVIQDEVPTGNTIAEQKLQMMYDFPELVKLRTDMRQNIGPVGLASLNVEDYKKMRAKLKHKH